MLHPAQDIRQLAEPRGARGFFAAGHRSQPDEGIQLIHGAVGLDARGIFGDALAARQTGFTLVATLGVDPVKRDARVIERFLWEGPFRHASMLLTLPALGWGVLNAVSPFSWIILLAAATAAGIANALAGGGTFLIFPALVFAGVDPIM